MKKKPALIFLILFLCCTLSGQKRLYSPFKLTDYENLRFDYLASVEKNKDSLIFIDNLYLLKAKLDSLQTNGNKYNAIYNFKKKDFKYYYIFGNNMLHISTDKKLEIIYIFKNTINAERITDDKLTTYNTYFNINGQLKETNTLSLPDHDAVGITERYNVIGKLLYNADWDKDFKLKKHQVKILGEKYFEDYMTQKKEMFELKENDFKELIKNYKTSLQPTIQKHVDDERSSIWILKYYMESGILEMKIDDKTKKFISAKLDGYIE
ncbi:hypothetical protein [Chryseobacterium sp. 5_R23647]|uniref:hypothetical protein n=1 Tax=Chryseobacterium sp. 5_R23647 TaxID=2258964 RepID=UPI000E2509A3|nr:hypothetical protein [Chryseobacterium sp. 5_R23647]REC40895.1 hypothetical protein DRF69_16700 [Chryseobacterium sp. 5_R23647]